MARVRCELADQLELHQSFCWSTFVTHFSCRRDFSSKAQHFWTFLTFLFFKTDVQSFLIHHTAEVEPLPANPKVSTHAVVRTLESQDDKMKGMTEGAIAAYSGYKHAFNKMKIFKKWRSEGSKEHQNDPQLMSDTTPRGLYPAGVIFWDCWTWTAWNLFLRFWSWTLRFRQNEGKLAKLKHVLNLETSSRFDFGSLRRRMQEGRIQHEIQTVENDMRL